MIDSNVLSLSTCFRLCIFDIMSIKPRCVLIMGPMEHNPTSLCFARSHDEENDMILIGDDGGCLNIVTFKRRFFIDNVTDGEPLMLNPSMMSKKDDKYAKLGMFYSKV